MMDSQCRYFRWTNKAVVKNSCSDCAAYRVCAFKGGTAPVCSVLDSMIEEELYLEKGSVVCNSSQPARDLYAVRSGALKECTIDRAGKERVIEFYFPGETVGLYALSQHTYRYCAISIEKSTVCRIPFDSLLERIKHMPRLQQNLLNMMSRQLFNRTLLNHFQSAEQQLAAFLITVSQRCAQLGQSSVPHWLGISRHDIAGYLQLTTETVCRVLTRFRQRGLITTDKKQIVIHKTAELAELAS
ncbi:cyclic nucleotide-binding domain-containing protein [Candidatus Glomeribacter gigasporarum]|nr:cyclic nucleotide-binding domain-containing protein [Candidatus Glomeribacter gigasporarum]